MKQKFLSTMRIDGLGYLSYFHKYINSSNKPYLFYLQFIKEFCVIPEKEKLNRFYYFCFSSSFNLVDWDTKKNITTNLLIKDLINLNTIWRLIKGYPSKGQRTHSNAKLAKKNKLLHSFRLDQFFSTFGYRKRNIYPTLIIAEYTNKLWFLNWFLEWEEAKNSAPKLVKSKNKQIPFDPVRLSKNMTNGYVRVGKAAKIGKSKKITKVVTIGVPVYFSRWIYDEFPPRTFLYKLWISDDNRKKMGVKRKKNKKK